MPDDAADDRDLATWCEIMGKRLALPLDKADRQEIIDNLRVLARQMDLVDGFALDDREEPAPQFRA